MIGHKGNRWAWKWYFAALCGTTLLFQNCADFSTPLGASSTLPSDEVPALKVGQTLYLNNCASCHGTMDVTTKAGKSMADIKNAMVAQPSMSNLGWLSDSDLSEISIALNTPTSTVDTGLATSFKTVISSRFTTASILTDLYVADSATDSNDTSINTLITNNIINHPEAFGGSSFRNDVDTTAVGYSFCSQAADCTSKLAIAQTAELVPSASATRRGYMIIACEGIAAIDKSTKTMLGKAGVDVTVAPTSASITNLLAFVFPGQTVDANSLAKLQAIATSAAAQSMVALDQWRFISLALCESDMMDAI